MHHRNLLAATITLSLLTACGGGDNDSGVTADPRPTSLNSSGNTPTTQTPSSSTARNGDKKSYESFDFNVLDLGAGKPKITILPPGKVQGADKNRLLILTDGSYKRINLGQGFGLGGQAENGKSGGQQQFGGFIHKMTPVRKRCNHARFFCEEG